MRTLIGTRLSHFEITAKLGEGGMGEVYRADDTKLKREVAIKVLPEAFLGDEERLARFEREAQLLAQLHHPHIASIFGLEEGEGVRGLVMELVEGETLAERLERGPVPLAEALEMARQIAEALEEAHGKGIIHRDLKPQNVKITPGGALKVLDFGLAKALDPGTGAPGSSTELTHSPTMTLGATVQGVILGTAAYMAPEQAKGMAVDKRADIWAFGVILYEMLTGERLFAGDSVPDTLAGVLKSEIDLGALPEGTPGAIHRLIDRCLERDPRRRLHDVADARIVIEDVLAGERYAAEGSGAAPAAAPVTSPRRRLLWAIALVAVAAGAAWLGYQARPPAGGSGQSMELAVHLRPELELVVGGSARVAFSPDGESLVFSGLEGGRKMLFRRRLDQREAVPIEGTEEAESPFFSPDGRWIGFIADDAELRKVPVEGGRALRLVEARGAGGATWLSNGSLIYAPIYSDGLFRISTEGGSQERLTTPNREQGELGHWWPQPLPGEHRVLFTAFRTPVDESRIGLLDLATGEIRWLVEGGFYGRYVPPGYLLYAKGHALYAAPFDAEAGSVTGRAQVVLDDVYISQTSGFAAAEVSRDGTLAYVTESLGNPVRQLAWLDRRGGSEPALAEARRYLSVSLSPDDRQAAVTIRGETRDLWTYSFERGTLSRLTSGDDTEFDPVWSTDGRELFYVVDSPPFTLYRIGVGTPDSGRPIWEEAGEFDTTGIAVSPDGETLGFVMTLPETGANLYARALDGDEPARPLRVARGEQRYPSFSPDGRWIAYDSNDSGRPEIYVERVPAPGAPAAERLQISADGGRVPLWARDGEIFYLHDDELWVVATRREGESLELEAPEKLFTYNILRDPDNAMRPYAVTADGQRILAVTTPGANRPRQIEVVTGWTGQLAGRFASE